MSKYILIAVSGYIESQLQKSGFLCYSPTEFLWSPNNVPGKYYILQQIVCICPVEGETRHHRNPLHHHLHFAGGHFQRAQ